MGCMLCPRQCGADRAKTRGFCGAGARPVLARAALHQWEEPPISGTSGSGTVFFSGCTLRCIFCQNREISAGMKGKEISTDTLSEIFLSLQKAGAHNINLVTGTQYAAEIIAALEAVRGKLHIPVVFNCGGYETVETVRLLAPYVDVWMPDLKYYDGALSEKYSGARDYFSVASKALEEMVRLAGEPVFDGGLMKSGVIVRHLVLPSHRRDSIRLMEYLGEAFGRDEIVVSLLRQYTPTDACAPYKELCRRVTTFEYESVEDVLRALEFQFCFVQEKRSASKEYIPPFDLTGVK